MAIQMDRVSLNYQTLSGETPALKGLTLSIGQGEFLGIVGPSGCGKSTLLSLICGLIQPSDGNVYVEGKAVDGISPSVGYMLQRDYLFEWRTVESNVLVGLEVQHKLTDESRAWAMELLDTYGLGGFKSHYPRQLSGGMRQKVALARTLALHPSILLLDEPFSALDYQTRLSVSDEIASIIRRQRITAVLVTHDISEAISLCDRVVVLSHRPATVKAFYEIQLPECLSAFDRRNSPGFSEYFNKIWKELDVHAS